MPNITNILLANIVAINDVSSSTDIRKNTGNISFDSSIGQFTSSLTLAAGANNINLPLSSVKQIYIKNIDVNKSITIQWNAGTLQTIGILSPGDQIIFWAGPNSSGVTQIILTPTAVGCLVEYFLGG